MKLTLSACLDNNLRTRPILDGIVKPEGIDLVCTAAHASEIFWRQLRFKEFDISEMSLSSYLIHLSKGNRDWVGIPVFTMRHLFHSWMLYRKSSGIRGPEDLKGRRVAVPEYQQTAALWSRGVLEHEFGVRPEDMEFHMERLPSQSHGYATGNALEYGKVKVTQIPPEKNMGQMLLDGELDATLLYINAANNDLVDRSRIDLSNHPDFAPLFDMEVEGPRYFKKNGFLHINHMMVVRRSLAEQHPWVPLNIFKAFQKANEVAEEQRQASLEYQLLTGLAPKSALQQLLSHGVSANRKTLETATQYSFEQGLTPRRIPLEEIFHESTLDQ